MLLCEKFPSHGCFIYRYDYQNGTINADRTFYEKQIYDESENLILDVTYTNKDTNLNEKQIYRYNINNKLTEYAEYDKEGLVFKKNINYGQNCQRSSFQIYKRNFKKIELLAESFYFYDKKN